MSVGITGTANGLAATFAAAAGSVSIASAAFNRLTNSTAAYSRMSKSAGELKLAGADTIASLQTTMAFAQSAMRTFARNRDVQIGMEIGREKLAEAWLRARPILQGIVAASRVQVAASIVAGKAAEAQAFMRTQRARLMRMAEPIQFRVWLAGDRLSAQVAAARARIDALKQYRAVRIVIAAVNAAKLPAAGALQALAPLSRLAGKGVIVALRATHYGVAVAVTKARALLSGLASHAKGVASSVMGTMGRIGGGMARVAAVGAGAAIAGVGGLAAYSIKLAAEAETSRVAFTTMLGSADKARQLQGEINAFAAATPFQTPELVGAAKALLSFGVAQDQIIPTMRALGDVSAGLNIPLGELSEIYGKARVQGRLYMEDVNQLTGRGIPVIQEFAKQFGVTDGEVRKMVEQGKIGFPQLQQAMISLTGEGGKFHNMMGAQSLTMAGLYSTLQDTVTMSLTKIGETITEKLDLRGAIAGVTGSLSVLADAAMPILESFIGGLAASGSVGQNAGNLVLSGAEMIAKGFAYAIDYSNLLVAGFKMLQAGATFAVFGVVKAVDLVGAGLVSLLNLMPGVSVQWTTFTGDLADGLIADARRMKDDAGASFNQFMTADSASKVGQFFDGVRTSAATAAAAAADVGTKTQQTAMAVEQAVKGPNQKVRDAMEKLKADVASFGLSDVQKELAELRAAGAEQGDLAEATGLLNLKTQLQSLKDIDAGNPLQTYAAQMEALQQLWATGKLTAEQFAAVRDESRKTMTDKLAADARSITESVKSPLEKYNDELANLQTMLDQGLITQAVFDKATAAAAAKLQPPELKRASLTMAGSAEAQAMRFITPVLSTMVPDAASIAGGGPRIPQSGTLAGLSQPAPLSVSTSSGMRETASELIQKQLVEMTKQTTHLKSIDDAVHKNTVSLITF
jgi:tape measure domain-containing protein